MLVYVLSFVAFVLFGLGLSTGLLLGRGEIRGSCGGLNGSEEPGCGVCGRSLADASECRRKAGR
jgi:hypothetical protein